MKKAMFIVILCLFLCHSVNSYSEIIEPGDSFRVYFDFSKSAEVTSVKAILSTLFFSNIDTLDDGEGWDCRVYDIDENPISPLRNVTAEEGLSGYHPQIAALSYIELYSSCSINIKGYVEHTNINGTFDLLDGANHSINIMSDNEDWEGGFLTTIEVVKAEPSPPKVPTISVKTVGSKFLINSDSCISSNGLMLSYAPYPNASYISSLDLGKTQCLVGDLPNASAFYVAIQNYNDFGLSNYSSIEVVLIENEDTSRDEKIFPYEVKGVGTPDVYPDHFGDNPDLKPMDEFLNEILSTGANTIKLTFTGGVMNTCYDNEFNSSIKYGSKLSDISSYIDLLKQNGLKVILAPYFQIADTVVGDSSVMCDRPHPSDSVAWFLNYRELILEYAEFAEQKDIDYYFIVQDSVQDLLFDMDLTDLWVGLAKDVKQVFSGKISSAVGFSPNLFPFPSQIPSRFINELDVIGITPLPRLTNQYDPSVNELVASYFKSADGENVINYLESIHKIYKKNILIGDRPFHSFDGANMNESVIYNESIPVVLDEQEQEDLYEAFFMALSAQKWSWFEGVVFSSMHRLPSDLTPYTARFLGSYGETFYGKQAEATVRDWFNGEL